MTEAQERRDRFDSLIARGYSTTDAGQLCNYSDRTAQEYRRQDRDKIQAASVRYMIDHVPVAVQQLIQLLTQSKSDAVKLNAINRVLAAAGLDVPQKHQITSLSDAELDAQLAAAVGGDSDKAIKIMEILGQGPSLDAHQ